MQCHDHQSDRRPAGQSTASRPECRDAFARLRTADSPLHVTSARLRQRLAVIVCAVATVSFSGCASLTNPTANGIPVRIVPEELLAESKEGFVPIPLTALRQPPPEKYLLAPGDTLGIYIEGILGNEETPPPVNIPDAVEQPPSIGYPFPIRRDGTISLPYVGNIKVAQPALKEGLTIEDVQEKVVAAYREKDILRVEDKRILVSLFRPRYVRVLVLRVDPVRTGGGVDRSTLGVGFGGVTIGDGRAAVGEILELPAYENDVLSALARTGGIPGLESTEVIEIQRGFWDTEQDPTASQCVAPTQADLAGDNADREITRIYLRRRPGEPLSFSPRDVILQNGDILFIRSRQQEFYYTGGLIPAREIPLPYDYDLTVVEAVLRSNGPLLNGGVSTSNLNGSVIAPGIGHPSPSLVSVVRKLPLGGQVNIRVDLNEAIRDPRQNPLVQADDVLILQEAPNEAVTRYLTQILQFNFFGRFINRNDGQGSVTAVVP